MFIELFEMVSGFRVETPEWPLPVYEGVCVRMPSWSDGVMAWQGATFIERGKIVRLQADDGRTFEAESALAAWKLFEADDASCWQFTEI